MMHKRYNKTTVPRKLVGSNTANNGVAAFAQETVNVESISKNNSDNIQLYTPKRQSGSSTVVSKSRESAAIREAMQEMSSGNTDEANVFSKVIDYPQIDLVKTQPRVYWERIWEMCVAYAATAMARNGDPTLLADETDNSDNPIGLYYLGALGLMYNTYLAFRGEIPVLQRLSPTLIELFHGVAPVIRSGMAWNPIINVDFDTLLQMGVPFTSQINPLVSLAPVRGYNTTTGEAFIDSTIPNIDVEFVRRFGTAAFEDIQQFVLGDADLQNVLQSYTNEGVYVDSIAAFVTANTGVTPINGVLQIYLEGNFPARESWIAALGFCVPINLQQNLSDETRQGWVAKTLQLGTHLFMLKVMKDGYVIRGEKKDPFQSRGLIHPVDIATSLVTELSEFIAGQYEFEEVEPIDVLNNNVFPSGFSSTISARQFALSHVANMSRRFAVSNAICSGTHMYNTQVLLIGAGSMFVTPIGPYDNCTTSMTLAEDLAALGMYYDEIKSLYNIPVLTSYGNCIDPRFGAQDLRKVATSLYPWLSRDKACHFEYPDFGAPQDDENPEPILCFRTEDNVSYTFGEDAQTAARTLSSLWNQLQGNVTIASFQDGHDAASRRHLNLGLSIAAPMRLELEDDLVNMIPFSPADRLWTTEPASRSLVTNYMTALVPTWIVPRVNHAAFQAVYKLLCSTEVDSGYLQYRSPKLVSVAHPIATNAMGGSALSVAVTERTVCGTGGGFFNQLLSGGKWINVAEKIIGGLASKIGPKSGKAAKAIVRELGGKVQNMFSNPSKVPIELRCPFEHGLMTPSQVRRLIE